MFSMLDTIIEFGVAHHKAGNLVLAHTEDDILVAIPEGDADPELISISQVLQDALGFSGDVELDRAIHSTMMETIHHKLVSKLNN